MGFGLVEEKYQGKVLYHMSDDEYARYLEAKAKTDEAIRRYDSSMLYDMCHGAMRGFVIGNGEVF
jgi:hypothetical protein